MDAPAPFPRRLSPVHEQRVQEAVVHLAVDSVIICDRRRGATTTKDGGAGGGARERAISRVGEGPLTQGPRAEQLGVLAPGPPLDERITSPGDGAKMHVKVGL